MKKTLILTAVLVMAVFTMASAAEFRGYLSDAYCGSRGMDLSGSDITMDPSKLTVETMKTQTCAAAGYGIFIYNNAYKKFVFFKFDEAGSDMARKQIVDKFNQKDYVSIIVQGELMKNGTIKVKRIMEDKEIRLKGRDKGNDWWERE